MRLTFDVKDNIQLAGTCNLLSFSYELFLLIVTRFVSVAVVRNNYFYVVQFF